MMTAHAASHPLPLPAAGTSIELFSGGGGLALALAEAGFEHLLLNEFDGRACQTLRANLAQDVDHADAALLDNISKLIGQESWPLVEGDVHHLDLTALEGRVDLVAGGVPCQPWSLGGAHRGYEDKRNLWPEFVRTVRDTRPRAFLAENVRGLLRPSFADYWSYTLDTLRLPHAAKQDDELWPDHAARLAKMPTTGLPEPADRYDVYVLPVNAADYGVPQIRQRVFTIGIRADLGVDWSWPAPTHSNGALTLDQHDGGDYWARHGLRPPEMSTGSLPLKDGLLPWRTLRDAVQGVGNRLPEPLGHNVEHPDFLHHFGWDGARIYAGHTPNPLDRPAKTVKAGVHGVPGGETVMALDNGGIRYMTVREVARVMTFPDHWRLAGPRGEQMRQLGNAVPVRLGAVMATAIATALRPKLS